MQYFDALVIGRDARKLTRYLTEQFSGYMQQYVNDMVDCRVKVESVGTLFDLMVDDKISLETTRDVLDILVQEPHLDPLDIVDRNKWWQLNDETELRRLCLAEMENNPALVAKYRGGKKKVINFFIGNVKKAAEGRGNAQIISRILQEILSK